MGLCVFATLPSGFNLPFVKPNRECPLRSARGTHDRVFRPFDAELAKASLHEVDAFEQRDDRNKSGTARILSICFPKFGFVQVNGHL